MASTLSGGRATHEIAPDPIREAAVSQLFIAVDPAALGPAAAAEETVERVIAHFRGDAPGESVRYPGERVLRDREESMAAGVPVDPLVWERLLAL